MSVEIRRTTEGVCQCGVPQPIDHEYTCRHHWECEWGRLSNPEADALRGIEPLMLITMRSVRRILDDGGVEPGTRGGVVMVTAESGRTFVHLDHRRGSWTWELFPAHFADRRGPDDLLIGRWPD